MENEVFDLQKMTFFTEGNTFTGSRTKDGETGALLRYLVRPVSDETGKRLEVFSWNTDVCFEKAPDPEEAQFPMDEEGLDRIQDWLRQQFERL